MYYYYLLYICANCVRISNIFFVFSCSVSEPASEVGEIFFQGIILIVIETETETEMEENNLLKKTVDISIQSQTTQRLTSIDR